MTPDRRGARSAREAFGCENGIATEYLVILILVALGAVLIVANYGRNVGNQVGAAGDKIGTLGDGGVATGSGGSEAGPSSGEGGRADASASSPAAAEPAAGGSRADGQDHGGRIDSGSASSTSAPASVEGPSGRQIAIGGIILVTIVLLVAVRISQGIRRASEQRVKQAEKAIREEVNRDLDEDTLNVKRSEVFGEEDPEKPNR